MSRVIVLGSVNRDLVLEVREHPRPGETVAAADLQQYPGGKGANQAVAASRAGAKTLLVGATGDDGFGSSMRAFLEGEGLDLGHLRRIPGRPTGVAIITVDARGENAIAVAAGANAALTAEDAQAIGFWSDDHVVAQFEVPEAFVVAGFEKAKAAGAVTILNPAPMKTLANDKPLTEEVMALCDILILNETELEIASGVSDLGEIAAIEAAARRLAGGQSRTVIVTLGKRGCLAVHPGGSLRIAGEKADVLDTTGAGDCFVGVFAASLAEGLGLRAALTRANQAASISVTRRGAASSMPYRAELA